MLMFTNLRKPWRNNPTFHSVTSRKKKKKNVPLTLNDIPFVVAVIVAVSGPVVDVEALDWGVVVTRRTVLDGDGEKRLS